MGGGGGGDSGDGGGGGGGAGWRLRGSGGRRHCYSSLAAPIKKQTPPG